MLSTLLSIIKTETSGSVAVTNFNKTELACFSPVNESKTIDDGGTTVA